MTTERSARQTRPNHQDTREDQHPNPRWRKSASCAHKAGKHNCRAPRGITFQTLGEQPELRRLGRMCLPVRWYSSRWIEQAL
uniref:Uncharacterized protein n=1 Tax=Mus musculus TaxID=10090 RepID=Q3UPP1_MOUSE|nr:unnamed protein product [Mus musculus]